MTSAATQPATGTGGRRIESHGLIWRPGDRIQILHVLGELDMATADGLAARGCGAFAHAWLLLLDLSDLSFCDARGLSALTRIANHAGKTGGRCALIAPQPQVAKLLLICRLNQRLPVFATVDDALTNLTATASTCTG
jgi:anti-anti-sigma factor